MAFAHALKLALASQAEFRIIHHADQGVEVDWNCFPKVKETLVQWKVLRPGCSQEEIQNLGLKVEGIVATGPEILASIFRHLNQKLANLLVLATHQVEGLNRWFYTPVAEPLARRTGLPTLFVPSTSEGCVSLEDGSVNLRRILLPINHSPNPQLGVDAAMRWARLLEATELECKLFYVGNREDVPQVELPIQTGWKWDTVVRRGNRVDHILEIAEEFSPHLIVMATQGHKGLLDVIRGNTTERVLRGVKCPVLAVPADSITLCNEPA